MWAMDDVMWNLALIYKLARFRGCVQKWVSLPYLKMCWGCLPPLAGGSLRYL